MITAAPFQSEKWYFKCCKWIRVVRIENPVTLIQEWNETCARARVGIDLTFVLEGTEPVTTLNQLHELAVLKKAVYCPHFGNLKKQKPAAFMLNLAGSILRRMFNSGMYVYQKKP